MHGFIQALEVRSVFLDRLNFLYLKLVRIPLTVGGGGVWGHLTKWLTKHLKPWQTNIFLNNLNFNFVNLTTTDVLQHLISLKPKTTGRTNSSNQHFPKFIYRSKLFLKTWYLSNDMETAKVSPIFKWKPANDRDNYKPVYQCCRVFQRSVNLFQITKWKITTKYMQLFKTKVKFYTQSTVQQPRLYYK